MNILNIISIICLALCFIMFFYFRWYIKKNVSSSSISAKELAARQKEVEDLIGDIDRITDRDSQLVEARIKLLKTLIEETDKRISVFVKELERSGSKETLYSSLGKGIRDALDISNEEIDAPVDTIELSSEARLKSLWASSTAPKQEPAAVRSDSIRPQEAAFPASPPGKHQIRSHIDLLLDEGLQPEEIASRLGISVAEVNLAMNLRRKKD